VLYCNTYKVLYYNTVLLIFQLSFNITTNSGTTALAKRVNKSESEADKKAVPVTEEPPFIFSDLPEHIR